MPMLRPHFCDTPCREAGGSGADAEVINRAFRAVHSIKSGGGYFNLVKIPELAHSMEDVLGLIRSGRVIPIPERVRVLLGATDKLRELISDPNASDQADIEGIKGPLAELFEEHRPTPAVKEGFIPAAPLIHQGVRALRIMVVEDDFALRHLLQSFLSKYGACHVAVNGREAVAEFSASLKDGQPYDLVCMDIMMPEMDGQEAVKEIRALEEVAGTLSTNGVKIIMLTALDDVKNVVESYKSLCDYYLFKPIDTSKLLARMKDLHLI
jgi:two-component system, chemotaxis family, chemotaxis protein CheY